MSAMSPHELGKRLIEFIEREVALEEDPIDPDTDLLLSGLVDSMGVIMVVNWMSDELGIVIDAVDVVLENFQPLSSSPPSSLLAWVLTTTGMCFGRGGREGMREGGERRRKGNIWRNHGRAFSSLLSSSSSSSFSPPPLYLGSHVLISR